MTNFARELYFLIKPVLLTINGPDKEENMGRRSESNRIQSRIKFLENKITKLSKKEAESRANWTRQYHAVQKYIEEYAGLKNVATKRAAWLKRKFLDWPQTSIELTKKRDTIRQEINQIATDITNQKSRLVVIKIESDSQQKMYNEIVDRVFALSLALAQAYQARDSYLSQHVFTYLVDDGGKLRRQITFINVDQTRKVTAMVNSISFLDPALASQAQTEIESFFGRFHSEEMDEATQTLYDLTQKLLTEKRTFKVGETLYRFLTMKLAKKTFPELVRAQDLLKSALRSEKTNSYVRIYERETSKDRWQQVKIS